MTAPITPQASVDAPPIVPFMPEESKWPHKYLLLALLVLVAGLAVTYQLWRNSEWRARQEMQMSFDFSVREAASRIEHRMAAYEQILRSTAGFLSHAESIRRDEFREYVDELDLHERFPGIKRLVFVQIVSALHKERHIAAVRSEGFPDYMIHPSGDRDIYTAAIYIEPFSSINRRAFGHDPYATEAHRAVMNLARDLDSAAITGKMTLVRETRKNEQAGFVMYQPVFRAGARHGSTDERRAAIIGWVSATFRMDDLMGSLFTGQASPLNVDIDIFDGEELSAASHMYDPHHHRGEDTEEDNSAAPLFSIVRPINIANHTWTMRIHSLSGLDNWLDRDSPRLLALAGAGISVLLALITLALASGKQRALQAAREVNRELIERETRYRQMFENHVSIAYLLDPESGRIIDANIAAAEFWGYSQQQLREMNIAEINTAPLERIIQIMREKTEGKRYYVEWRHRLKNGEVRDVQIFSGPLAYQGKVLVYSILHDITARKQAEKALAESEFRWKFALEGAGDGVWDWNLVTNEVQYSSRFKNMLGYAEEEIDNTYDAWEKLVHPADKPYVIAGVHAYLQGRTALYMSEYRMRSKTHDWKWVLARGMAISRDDAGRALRIIGTQSDITDRKHAERRQVHRLIEAAPDPMILVDQDGCITFANTAAQSTFGYAADEFNGLNVDNLVPLRIRDSHGDFRKQFRQREDVHSLTATEKMSAMRKDGTEFPIEMTLSKFKMEGQPVVIASIRDISERQRAANMLQQSFAQLRRLSDHQQNIKEEERKRIAQDIHDELGQNLLVLKMDVAMLCARTGGSHPKLNKRASLVLDNINAALQSVKTIMNNLRPATLELGLHPAVDWQVKQFERTSGIACELVTSAPDTHFGLDESQTIAVFRILQESLTNVARHSDATEVGITLCQHEHGFSMTVTDNGKGLQADDSGKENSFGLIGMKARTESLGGQLTISSSPGKGTSLSISIPLKESTIAA